MAFTIENILVIGVVGLLGIGLYGLLATRNMIKMIIVLQVLVKTALLGIITAGHIQGQVDLGQSFALTILVADTVVAVIGLALAVQVRQRIGTLDVTDLSQLRK